MLNSMLMVGSSTLITGSASGFSASAMVSPILNLPVQLPHNITSHHFGGLLLSHSHKGVQFFYL